MAEVAAAPAAATAHTEDDETWLYGDENKEPKDSNKEKKEEAVLMDDVEEEEKETKESSPKKRKKVDAGDGIEKSEDKEEGEMSGEEAKEEDDDSDDDDNVQVTIGDIKQWTVNEAPRNLFKSSSGYPKPSAGTPLSTTKVALTAKTAMDVDSQGTINGIPTYEFDLDSLPAEDKPWRNPGADITDYFNYGFNEDSWQQYCEKQRRLRLENGVPLIGNKSTMMHSYHSGIGQPISRLGEKDSGQTGSSIPTTSSLRKAQPPPNRKLGGTIDVIGSTAHDSRRPGGLPIGSSIPIAGTPDYRKFPPTAVPPPGMPPIMPDYSMPPPGMPMPPGLPPPGVPPPPGVAVPTVPGMQPYDPFSVPPPGYNFDSTTYPPGFGDSHHQNYNSYDDRWKYGTERHRERDRSPDSEYGSSESEKDYRRERNRRDSSRKRSNRDTYYRERDREPYRDRERDRGRERGRDRERVATRPTERDDSRHREDKHRPRTSSRKHKEEEEEEHHRSKHRRSRKRRDKEDDESVTDEGDKD